MSLSPAPTRRAGVSLRVRVFGAFLLSFTFFLGALGYGLVEFRRVGAALDLADQGYLPLLRTTAQLEKHLVRMEPEVEPGESNRPLSGLRSNSELYASVIAAEIEAGRGVLARVLPGVDSLDDQAILETIDLQLQTIAEQNHALADATLRYLDQSEAGEADGARQSRGELLRAWKEMQTEIDELSATVNSQIRLVSERSATAQQRTLLVSGVLSLAALGFGVAMLTLSMVSLRPIGRMTAQVGRIADGEYEGRIVVSTRDELGVLAEGINEMAQAIQLRDGDLRTQAEAQLKSQDRLARAERLALIGQMLAQITHEVRNPLNAMSLNAELLAEELDALPEERRQEALEILGTVTEEIGRLEETTQHYLALARRPAPTLEPVDPHELARGVQRLLDEELRRAGVEMKLSTLGEGLVELDETQLRRALLNVIRNAVEAGARHVAVSVELTDELRLTIDDDGPGLSPEEAERAFDPFYSTKATGSGLGLAITRQILEDHGGAVAMEPHAQGTRVLMQVPRG